MTNVVQMFPCGDFKVVADEAAEVVKSGVVIGFGEDGDIHVLEGGLTPEGTRLNKCQILWLVESFKTMLMNGELD